MQSSFQRSNTPESLLFSVGNDLEVTMLGSAMAAAWRVCIMPIDVMKTVSQCDGNEGYAKLLRRVFREGQVRASHGLGVQGG